MLILLIEINKMMHVLKYTSRTALSIELKRSFLSNAVINFLAHNEQRGRTYLRHISTDKIAIIKTNTIVKNPKKYFTREDPLKSSLKLSKLEL